MKLPVIVGWSDSVERTGPTFQAECPTCKGVQRFYAAKKKFNVTAFFSVSLWDNEEPVVQCAHCQQCFDPDDITALTPSAAPTLRQRVADALGLDQPAPAKADAAKAERARVTPPRAGPTKAEMEQREDDEIAAELAAMKRRLGKR